MSTSLLRIVVTDANVLINLMRVSRLGLLAQIPNYEFVVPDHVREEITIPEQRATLDAAVTAGWLKLEVIDDLGAITAFTELTTRIGRGEAACIAIAAQKGWLIASEVTSLSRTGWCSMFLELVRRNDDLKRLVEKGYAVGFDSGHLVVRDVPYLDNQKKLQIGAFVTKLEFIDKTQVKQQDHQVFFCGAVPHDVDGAPIQNLGGGPVQVALKDPALVVQRSFSNKPLLANGAHDPNGFPG